MNPGAQTALQLRDIHLPGAPSFWPPAPGWWLLAALSIALLIWVGMVAVRRYRIHRRRRSVLAALASMEERFASERSPERLASISMLLRRLALMCYPREQVAALSGTAWLHFLDKSGGNGRFANGPGRVLASGPYQRSLPPELDTAGLAALVREWVQKNSGGPA